MAPHCHLTVGQQEAFADGVIVLTAKLVHDPWTTVTVDLPAGPHTVSWRYVKEGSNPINADHAWLDDVFFPPSAVITNVEDDVEVAEEHGLSVRLSPNAPNPFTMRTTISYVLPRAQTADLIVFDALGREVAVLASGFQAAGTHRVQFEPGLRANGVYFLHSRTEDGVRGGSMVRVE